jgi:hypothetical protein
MSSSQGTKGARSRKDSLNTGTTTRTNGSTGGLIDRNYGSPSRTSGRTRPSAELSRTSTSNSSRSAAAAAIASSTSSPGIRAAKAYAVEKMSPGKDKDKGSPSSVSSSELSGVDCLDDSGWKHRVRRVYLTLIQQKAMRRKGEIKDAWATNVTAMEGEIVGMWTSSI